MMNTVIVGCGQIGALKDDKYDSVGGKEILTWAHAAKELEKESLCKLVGLVDLDDSKAILAGEKWDVPSWKRVEDITEQVDAFVIAVPEQFHLQVYKECVALNPKVIILEKPAGRNGQDAVDLLGVGFKNTIVNYTRRFNQFIAGTAKECYKGDYGKIYSARIYYNRGLLRDGCHAIDMIRFFFGEILDISFLTHPTHRIPDYSMFDPTVSLAFRTERCPTVQLIGIDGREYSIFEMEIMTQDMRIVFVDNFDKCKLYRPEKEPVFGNYDRMPSEPSLTVDTGLVKELLINPLKDAISVAKYNSKPRCDLYDSFKTHSVINQVFNLGK